MDDDENDEKGYSLKAEMRSDAWQMQSNAMQSNPMN